ncbi:histidine--tRNA ligase [Sulfitobacter pseudonitzschiae]|uniref:Histidine--tRNA ligase n=1 Tax=Pseudosulfitobacter pseudonitzschiae TaxID=1402135 RepID=A0A9Q2NRW5_9RHOB|nr:histidine--tRNA ligase [Pseudosulfitobacter pseudonitzschiae]MBM2293978.1 histidine--tRNA ligase [Pseudosulfitobacter pseudonitzschiae]MBM2298875.1 histidine--tRNA ligase [Pseudosulfitobacter pseudonitzschiae]MBM2303789.1 histidine--tRNA ligase [Pseudosulfitobacter pseudonitzschiae]MBM2313592.1 histidine--tRNA ligase [Pseudosulfitobacter pseudonitzschiae]MBM2318486.1 histidine--tRNA ligase [Pseudosulfitobacter pseudonitzschiae]
MAKPKKTPRPKAETPKGFRDYFGTEVTARTEMLQAIAGVYHRYGFDALETSAVETVEALGKFLPDVDRPNAGVFGWQEDGEGDKPGDWLALRYDMTAPLARVYAQHRNDLPNPYRRYAMGPVWRNEKPGPGRFRQFYQCDADTVGSASMGADAEICAMLADTLEQVGIPRGDYIIRVNNRKVLNGVMEVAGVLDPANPEAMEHERGIVLRAIDKLDRLGTDGVRALLGAGRKDDSGDFTDGAGLSDAQADVVMGFMEAKRDSGAATVARLRELVAGSQTGEAGVDELEEIAALLAAGGYGPDRIEIDPSVVRGLGYYTGPVYEAELTFEIFDEKGRKRQFGSVAGGGRYDDLVKRFTGQEVPATGVSIGVDRLLAALTAKGRMERDVQGPVVVTVMDRARMADYQAMVAELRQAGIRAEVYLGNPKNFGNQLKYADKRGSPVAIIEGGDEKERGVVQIKDLILGAKIAETATHEEWKDRPSQFEVPRDEMLAKVREILEGQDT